MEQLKQYVISYLQHHVSEALAVSSSPDTDAIVWLATSNDPFHGFIVTTTANCVGANELVSWASNFEQKGDKRNAARLFACAGSVANGLHGAGLASYTRGEARNVGQHYLEKSAKLLEQSSAIGDEDEDKKEQWCVLEFNICKELTNALLNKNVGSLTYRDRAVLLGQFNLCL
jgi:hypothetical protein